MNLILYFRSVEYFSASTLHAAFPDIQVYHHLIKIILNQNIYIFLLVDLQCLYHTP